MTKTVTEPSGYRGAPPWSVPDRTPG